MKKRIVSVLLCVALTMIPAMSSFATEAETDSNTTPSSEIVVEKLDKDTNPSKDNKKSSVEEKNTKSEKPTSTEKSDETPASDNEDSKDEKENESTEEPGRMTTPISKRETPDTTVPPTTTEPSDSDLESKDDVDLPKSKSGSKGPLGDPGDTTWQDDWTYTLDGNSIILSKYNGTTETDLVIPSSATISGTVYSKVEFDIYHSLRMFYNHTELNSIDLKNVDTSKCTDMSNMFTGCSNLTSLDLSGFDTSNVTNMHNMFLLCGSLTNLDVSGFDTNNVTDMTNMFGNCYSLTSLDLSGFNTSNADIGGMFSQCYSLTSLDVSSFDTSNATETNYMFHECRSLTSLDISGFDASNVSTAEKMFYNNTALSTIKTPTNLSISVDLPGTFIEKNVTPVVTYTTLPQGLTTSKTLVRVEDTDTTWQNDWTYTLSGNSIILSEYNGTTVTDLVVPSYAKISGTIYNKVEFAPNSARIFFDHTELNSIDLKNVDTSNLVYSDCMFSGCSNLTSLDVSGFDTSNVIFMSAMFRGCNSLTNLDVSGFDTSNVISMYDMFKECNNLTNLDVSGFDTSNVTDMSDMFYECRSLTSLDLSSFDMSSTSTAIRMLKNCDNLNKIITPKNLSRSVDLPGTFMEKDVTPIVTYTTLPQNLTTSKTLVRYYAPESITVDPTSKTIDIDEEFTITATVLPATTTEPTVTWISDKPGIASVDNNGKVKGITEGTATITAKTVNDLSATCEVTVKKAEIPVDSITVNPTSKTIAVNDTFTITATVLPTDATDRSVTWISDKPGIASVDNNGKVKGITEGTAKITARSSNGLEAICEVTVSSAVIPVDSISVDPTSKTIVVNDEFTITATVLPTDATDKSVTWYSDTPAVATVDANGKVKGVSVGSATITARTGNDLTATCEVTVKKEIIPATSVSVDPTTKTIVVNDEFTITATVLPTDATDRSVTWSSNKPEIATVDKKNGKVKGIAEGTATITAKTNNDLKAECVVIVKKAPSPTYSLIVVDNRTSPPHPELVTASVTTLKGNRFLLINNSNGKIIRQWIKLDSSLKYDSIEVYDMRLTDSRDGGNDMNDFGECTIRLALPSYMNNNTGNIRIVTMKDGTLDKSLAYSVEKVNGVLCITFTTPHFTDFAILYKDSSHKKGKPDHHSDDSNNSSSGNTNTNANTGVVTTPTYYGWPTTNILDPNRILDTLPKTGEASD